MSVFQRIGTLLRANINELLDRAEDPEVMLKQMILDMEDSVREGKVALSLAITEEKKLRASYEENLSKAQSWMEKAELAVEQGADDLAREALKRSKTAETNAETAKSQWEQQRQMVAQMREDLDTLESRVAEAKSKKDILIARQRRAEATKKVQEQLAGIGKNQSAFDTFERMEEKVEHLEAQASAAMEIRRDSLDERLNRLGADKDVEDDLAALKQKVAEKKNPPAGS